MRTTIDGAGRIVIPKAVRDEAGIRGGAEVDVEFRDGRIEIEPTTAEKQLVVAEEGGAVIRAGVEMPPLTSDQVRDVLERVRR